MSAAEASSIAPACSLRGVDLERFQLRASIATIATRQASRDTGPRRAIAPTSPTRRARLAREGWQQPKRAIRPKSACWHYFAETPLPIESISFTKTQALVSRTKSRHGTPTWALNARRRVAHRNSPRIPRSPAWAWAISCPGLARPGQPPSATAAWEARSRSRRLPGS